MVSTSRSIDPLLEHRPQEVSHGAGISVSAESSSQHPCDWGRALASAVSRLVEQIIDTTGVDPCREPGGLELSVNIVDLPGGEAITVTWLPSATKIDESSSGPPLTP